MRAVRLHAPGERLRVEDVPQPEAIGDAVRVRVAGAGVCRTDLGLVDGTQTRVELPRTLGHEISGWIDEAGAEARPALRASGLDVGDAVVVHGGWGCGDCPECRAGLEQRCANSVAPGFQADGGYADAVLVPHARHLVGIGPLDPVAAAPLGDAGITARRAVERIGPWLRPGARVLVIGAGGVGQFLLSFLRLAHYGDRLLVVACEPHAARRARAIRMGADAAIADDRPADVAEALGGAADVVLDVVGTDATLALSADVVTPGGLVLVVGEGGGSLPVSFDHPPVESWITTVAWGSLDDLRAVVALARSGALAWDVERVPLAEAQAAHDRLRAGDVEGRLVLVP